jgi:hypothetical protein
MSKTGLISLVFWIISLVLFFQESPYWLWAILTISIALLIPMIKWMWDMSGWMLRQTNQLISGEKVTITFKL